MPKCLDQQDQEWKKEERVNTLLEEARDSLQEADDLLSDAFKEDEDTGYGDLIARITAFLESK